MQKVLGYQCSFCGKEYSLDEVTYTCPQDGANLDVLLNYNEIKRYTTPEAIFSSRETSIWRYLPLLPVDDPGSYHTPLWSVGWTPIHKTDRLAADLGLKNLWIKDESGNPSASFKDRASAILVARAREIGAEIVITASTGNAGAALACMAAATGQKAVILSPKTAPPAKVAQLLIFGAEVILVNGTYDDAFDLSVSAANEFGWYCRNTGYNPFTAEGKKTAAFEIWEQILFSHELKKPLCLFVSVGDGNIISGLHKGFKDLQALGWLKQVPRIFGVQSTDSAAIANTFNAGTETIIPVSATTLADSISVDLPRDGLRALRAATQTGGAYVLVPDEEIIQAISVLGTAGIFAEPAGAAAYAGVKKALEQNLISIDDTVLALNTGSGLKDVRAAMQAAGEARVISPDLNALKTALSP
ncbi:MAG: threonine synthase [Anaerolineales bacterium]|nr:threonine synthase [Anaerolineales bacterium]